MRIKRNKRKLPGWKKREYWFFGVMMAVPVLHFLIWYVVLNANSFALAFRKFDFLSNRYVFAGWENFKAVIQDFLSNPQMAVLFRNSMVVYIIGLVITLPLTLLFAFYLYKKFPGHGVFKFVLYLPSMLSSIVVVTIFTYFVERYIPGLVQQITGKEMQGFLSNPDSRFSTIVFYNLWIGFGGSMLYYLGSMNGIPPELVEAAKIDGVNLFGEFIHITLPMIWPTLTTVITTGVVSIFTNQLSLVTFYGTGASSELQTIGYWLFADTLRAEEVRYPYLSAAGLIITFIAAPLTFLVKYLMERFGPKDVEV